MNVEKRLQTEFGNWFQQVTNILGKEPENESDWAELWFDYYTPEEAIEEMGAGALE